LGYATRIQAFSHAFQDTFRDATVYAVVGCFFLLFFFLGRSSPSCNPEPFETINPRETGRQAPDHAEIDPS